MAPLLAQAPTSAPATPSPSWTDLSLLDWQSWGFEIRIGLLWILLFVAASITIKLGWPYLRRYWRGVRFKGVKLSFKGPEVEICPDHEIRRVAYQAWVEIQTRKAGLLFDEEHDVITEVYDSWYQLFGVLRVLSKTIPAECYANDDDACKLVKVLLESLNDGLRPHLTRWQARFRRWYAAAIAKDEAAARSPQEIQRDFPEYAELVADLCAVNKRFVNFAADLHALAQGGA
ncbi:MAG: hypothetical protein KC547_21725 [Anaerolineae bacterium]|nr:hypothetical protein [Anaerolineae bacterium]